MEETPHYIVPEERYLLTIAEDGSALARLSISPTKARNFIKTGATLFAIISIALLYLIAFRWDFEPENFVVSAFFLAFFPATLGAVLFFYGLNHLLAPRLLWIDAEHIRRVVLEGGKPKPYRAAYSRADCEAIQLRFFQEAIQYRQRLAISIKDRKIPIRIASSAFGGEITALAEAISTFTRIPLVDHEGVVLAFDEAPSREVTPEHYQRLTKPVLGKSRKWPSFSQGLKEYPEGAHIMRMGQDHWAIWFFVTMTGFAIPFILFQLDDAGNSLFDLYQREAYIPLVFIFSALALLSFIVIAPIVVALRRTYLVIEAESVRVLKRQLFGDLLTVVRAMPPATIRALKIDTRHHSEDDQGSSELRIMVRRGKDIRRILFGPHTKSFVKRVEDRGLALAKLLGVPLLGEKGNAIWRPERPED